MFLKRDVSILRGTPVSRLSLAAWVVIWLAWTGAEAASWIVGLPMLAAAMVFLGLLESSAVRVRAGGLPRLAGFFLFESLRGGWDVARRALSRDMGLRPDLQDYDTVLNEGPARVFLINCISLMPGTATVEREEGHLKLHVLDGQIDCVGEVRRLESRVAEIFAEVDESREGVQK